ncbi:phage major tail tube protein [Desulfarculus baarsii]|uniref:phage major tail tube protein n=1 Tax=Desulfarculus baarsii TaxID=453230 RepID=UPI00068218C5|nr:phage major tail tube protein [Desulfarculus baarsii]
MNKIPQTLIGFAVYGDSDEMIGVADVELPDLEATTVEIKGAGIAGAADMPIMGHYGGMGLTINWRAITGNHIALSAPKAHDLTIRGSIQHYDAGTGEHATAPLKVVVKAAPKKTGLGKLDTGEQMDASAEFEVLYIKITLDDDEVLEIDKFNYICKIGDTDYLESVRADLGK